MRDPAEMFRAAKWVRIMCDYGCDGIWDKEGRVRSIDEMPVSGMARERLLAWQSRFDDLDDRASEMRESVPTSEWREFVDEGLAIARELKRELPD